MLKTPLPKPSNKGPDRNDVNVCLPYNLVNLRDLRYIKGAGIYSELHVQNSHKYLHDKLLEKLTQLLPDRFYAFISHISYPWRG